MDFLNIYILLEFVGIGIAAGVLAGLFGVGGGIIMGPFLIFYLESKGIPQEILVQLVFGTVLFVIIFTAITVVWRHHRNGNVIWKAAIPLGIIGILGALTGSTIVAYTPGSILKRIFGLALFYVSYQLFREIKSFEDKNPRYDWIAIIPSGFAIGVISGLLGVGGGIVGIPLMALVLHYPYRKIAGTSSAIIVFTGISAVIGYVFHGWNNALLPSGSIGYVNITIAIPLLIGTVLGSPLGVYIHEKLPTQRLRQLFALVLIVEGIKLLI